MKILQLIDTLNPGGAERMAVNYANSLIDFGQESFLVTTREEGGFTKLLNKEVKFFFLKREKIFDKKGILNFKKYLYQHDIDIVHAHGTSWFFAVLCKLTGSKFKLIWHNHYGASKGMSLSKKKLLILFSRFFDGIISVNQELKEWADDLLKARKSISLVNFVLGGEDRRLKNNTGLNVVCIANLKPVKNHKFLLEACDLVSKEIKISLHLIGQEFGDDYSIEMNKEFNRRSYVKFHGPLLNPGPILNKMQVGVLSSNSEGMPMVILEYGIAGIPVVSTDVGACRNILGENANIVASGDVKGMAIAIRDYLINSDRAEKDSREFQERVLDKFSAQSVIPDYLQFCKNL
ncbi:glycosyltransferase [Gramella sp. MAR_2010_147]|uniref:glycosyltransferase n=1 Tax=Gramella sp. MAR_2010_147 TaxID=1250205 RepID=UPI00087D5DDF|nr:glycosyltransferase [Gramella sp. MAR_2010_147]SDS00864.1 Glycosyltransferase involved in cell wall bisynthesis [Gramella sp. MAR_2010_147]